MGVDERTLDANYCRKSSRREFVGMRRSNDAFVQVFLISESMQIFCRGLISGKDSRDNMSSACCKLVSRRINVYFLLLI